MSNGKTIAARIAATRLAYEAALAGYMTLDEYAASLGISRRTLMRRGTIKKPLYQIDWIKTELARMAAAMGYRRTAMALRRNGADIGSPQTIYNAVNGIRVSDKFWMQAEAAMARMARPGENGHGSNRPIEPSEAKQAEAHERAIHGQI